MTTGATELGTVSKTYTVTFHRRIDHSADRVWAALTEPALISKWNGGGHVTVDLRPGGAWEVRHSPAAEPWLPGVIVRLDAARRIDVAWELSINSYTIQPTADGCVLTLTSNGNRFPGPGSDWTAPGVAAGWHRGLDALSAALDDTSENAPSDPAELTQRYARKFDQAFRDADVLSAGPAD